MGNRLEGKVAVVTGATSGIGLAIATRFATEGAHVFITGRRTQELEAARVAIGPNATAVAADSSKPADLERLYAAVKEQKGHLDIVVANAGGGSMVPLGAITEEHYADTFDRNVKGVLFTVQSALPILAAGASVIVMGSTAGTVGTPNFSMYSASKAAVRALVRNWILDLKGKDIRINTLSPGPTRTTGLVELAGPDAQSQQGLLDYLASQVPLGRVAEPNEIANAALFLASSEASFVTGSELFVDGGVAQI